MAESVVWPSSDIESLHALAGGLSFVYMLATRWLYMISSQSVPPIYTRTRWNQHIPGSPVTRMGREPLVLLSWNASRIVERSNICVASLITKRMSRVPVSGE